MRLRRTTQRGRDDSAGSMRGREVSYRVIYEPHRVMRTGDYAGQVTYVIGTREPKWCPCSMCGGAGGALQSVSWHIASVWISCPFCMGGGGMFLP